MTSTWQGKPRLQGQHQKKRATRMRPSMSYKGKAMTRWKGKMFQIKEQSVEQKPSGSGLFWQKQMELVGKCQAVSLALWPEVKSWRVLCDSCALHSASHEGSWKILFHFSPYAIQLSLGLHGGLSHDCFSPTTDTKIYRYWSFLYKMA
jgi:hypothetical protein